MLALMWVACSVASAGTVYKWVDDNGVVHYSDQPHENADQVELKEPQTYSAVKGPPQPGRPPPTAQDPRVDKPYDSCSFSQPTADQVFFNTFDVTVVLQAQPALRFGDQVNLTLDGKPVPTATGGQFTLTQLDRGTHSVQATILNAAGKTLCQTPSVSFNIRQPSQQAPNPANRPKG